jgi:hypothetical protein
VKRKFVIFFIIFFLSFPQVLFAKELMVPSPTPTLVDYQLPYPGILHDNLLYKLKALRDKLVEFLIADPLR